VNHVRLAPPHAPDVTVGEASFIAFQRELDYIYRAFRRLGVQNGDVDDLGQDLFVVLHRSWTEYDPARPLRPYLFGIAFRITSAYKRRKRRERAYRLRHVGDVECGPDELFREMQSRALLMAALDRIPLARRAVLIMHELDEVPVSEVARVLSIPLFTVYSRLRKARRELQVAYRRLAREANANVVARKG
jgi:RNA polymerase sigma-70 factor, ECF subfamily